MDLYVCWTTRDLPLPPRTHPCTVAYDALREAGYDPKVKYAHSLAQIPGFLQTPTRKKVKEHTGEYWVPALETDDGEWVGGSQEIVAWAEQHPASA
jgi:hypothetical protein